VKIDLTSEQKSLYIVFLHEIRGESKMLSRIFPGIPRDNRERHLKFLQSLIRSGRVLFVPVASDLGKLTTFLEFNLGLTLNSLSKDSPGLDQNFKSIGEASKLELELYEHILNYFNVEVAKLIEFDFE
jgi:hypothetical protein